MKSNKFWLAILGGVIAVSAVITLFLQRAPADLAYIYLDGMLIESCDLSTVAEPFSFTVESGYGINVISVERGRICVSQADCHDKLCVRQGWISGGSAPIVCLPHRLVIKLESKKIPNVDAVVG